VPPEVLVPLVPLEEAEVVVPPDVLELVDVVPELPLVPPLVLLAVPASSAGCEVEPPQASTSRVTELKVRAKRRIHRA
jgi:hypothetical protein